MPTMSDISERHLLFDVVKISPRFQKAIRIDKDLGQPEALDGFVCPKSSSDALLSMARHVSETGQCAFTWTGPYGSGKSSLLIALGSLLGSNPKAAKTATQSIGKSASSKILDVFPPQKQGWKILPVIGSRSNPVDVFAETISNNKLVPKSKTLSTDAQVLDALLSSALEKPQTCGGLIVFIDEMGKFLEGAATTNADIYFFQQLAETASRSNNRLIVIGVLHQAFSEYAHRLSRDMRDEWTKIQGRFIDLPINVAGEEQIELLARAIQCKEVQTATNQTAKAIVELISGNKKGIATNLAETLTNCWPLHPLVACLLGPISRRRFGQNQRSLFGFLNSAEPAAFRAFLKNHTTEDIYTIDLLWDYLKINLEPTILTSPDGHRWALAAEAIDRCESQVTKGAYVRILKAIALIDLFKGNSGLSASPELLKVCFEDLSETEIDRILNQLQKWSLVIFKKHLGAYAIFAGSDFDIDEAVSKARENVKEIDFSSLKKLINLQPILAKRHYHETGSLRWFDVEIVPIDILQEIADNYRPKNGSIGQFILAISTQNESEKNCQKICQKVANTKRPWDSIVGLSKQSWSLNELATEILALEKVYDESHELSGDSVARKEIRANLAELQAKLEAELSKAFDRACWYGNFGSKEISRTQLSVLVSNIADKRFHASPKIHNELLNRIKPSSNAIGAQNQLLKQMAVAEGEERLGIIGFPAEGGLYDSILGCANLYAGTPPTFISPNPNNDSCNLAPSWDVAIKYLQEHSDRAVTVEEIFSAWREVPFGIKDGLLPVLGTAFILSQRGSLAFYREGIFQSKLSDLDVEILAKNPSDIQLRYMNLSEVSKTLLSGMAEIVRELDEKNTLNDLEPIDVARGLISIYDNIHPWAQRTMRLTKEAIRIRNLFKKANDPNKFLFDDIPGLLGQQVNIENKHEVNNIISFVHEGLKELKEAYSTELGRIRDLMLSELQVPNTTPQALAALRDRAENIKDISGDFRLEAFIVRLTNFVCLDSDLEGIASLATNKPPRNWIDNDLDKAKVEIMELSQKFIRTESFARVKGRKDKRHSLSVVVGINGRPTPIHQDFEVADSDREKIDNVIGQLKEIIQSGNELSRNITLAALVELCAQYIQDNTKIADEGKEASND